MQSRHPRDDVAHSHDAATFLVHLAEGSTVVPSTFDAQLLEESADEHVRKNLASLLAFREEFAPREVTSTDG